MLTNILFVYLISSILQLNSVIIPFGFTNTYNAISTYHR